MRFVRLLVEASVPGVPRTKGSLTHRGGGRLTDSDLSIAWRRLVAYQVRRALPEGYEPFAGPVYTELFFTLPGLDWSDIIRQGAGDKDKLERNVLDALAVDPKKPDLSAGVYINDAQVIDGRTAKQPDRAGILPRGLFLRVWEVDPDGQAE